MTISADAYPPVMDPVRTSTALSVDRARVLARALDSAVRLPGTRMRFGLDALLGLIPGLGDVTTAAMGSYLILLASRLGAPKPVLTRMVLNVGVDTIVGIVPVAGDLFDVAWKANMRNLALLERYLENPVATKRSSRLVVFGLIALLAALAVGGIVLAVLVVQWIFGLLF